MVPQFLFQPLSSSGGPEILPHLPLQAFSFETEQSESLILSSVSLKFYRWDKNIFSLNVVLI